MASEPVPPPLLLPSIWQLEDAEKYCMVTRYLTVAGMVILVYEIVTNLPMEIRVVWRSGRSVQKYLFLAHRYCPFIGLLAALQSFSGFTKMNTSTCQLLCYTFSAIATLSIGLADALVSIEVWEHWDRSKTAMFLLGGAFILTYAIAVVCMALGISWTANSILWNAILNSCVIETKPPITAAVWGSGLCFEVVAVISAVWNVLDKPRPKNTKLGEALLRDGILYFLGVIVFRLFNIVMSLRAPYWLLWATLLFAWTILTLLTSRLILNQFVSRYVERSARRFGQGAKLPFPLIQTEVEVIAMDGSPAEDKFEMQPTNIMHVI